MQEVSRVLAAAERAAREAESSRATCQSLSTLAADHRRWCDDRYRVLTVRLDDLHALVLKLSD